ncbi:hypothetical protein C8F04DRAFT_1202640 [Mycena alexandri]|uniref:Uncharacterized protein n=1 Tax=Mycena alexandri TaxID=1745969 RepID=A0AAD6RXZ0_9AGAR|nr:hypothetical protein C8F04DRAFT_1202640 [Mycena alexandri]
MTKKSRNHCLKDSDPYFPGSIAFLLSKEEKARNHRKAQKTYYERYEWPVTPWRERDTGRGWQQAGKGKKTPAPVQDEPYVPTRLSTPSWANLELPPRSEMRTEPVADCHTVYSAVSRGSIGCGEKIAIDALVTLSQPQHVAEEWPRPASDSILERAMGLTSSSACSPPASLRPAARNVANAGAGEAGAAVLQALEAVATLNKRHPMRSTWANLSERDYFRTFWTRDDHPPLPG